MARHSELPYYHRRRRRASKDTGGSPYVPLLFFLVSLTFCFYQTLNKPQNVSGKLKVSFFSGASTSTSRNPYNYIQPRHFLPQPLIAKQKAISQRIRERPKEQQQSSTSVPATPLSAAVEKGNGTELATMSAPVVSPPSSSPQPAQVVKELAPMSPPPSPVPAGLVPLPTLGQGEHASSLAGASWTAAATKGLTSYLPAFLKVHAMSSEPVNIDDSEESIFTARRKGKWIGCTSRWHLVCKGVYRAIKKSGAINVLDVSCAKNRHWLPMVLLKLRQEFRIVSLICGDPENLVTDEARVAYAQLKHVTWQPFDVFKEEYKNNTDLLIAYDVLRQHSLIQGVRLFRRAKESGRVKYITFDNYPDVKNSPTAATTSPVNVLVEPFMFPNAFHLHEDPMEQPNPAMPIQIMTMKLEDLFAHSFTPELTDMIDPRERRRRLGIQAG